MRGSFGYGLLTIFSGRKNIAFEVYSVRVDIIAIGVFVFITKLPAESFQPITKFFMGFLTITLGEERIKSLRKSFIGNVNFTVFDKFSLRVVNELFKFYFDARHGILGMLNPGFDVILCVCHFYTS